MENSSESLEPDIESLELYLLSEIERLEDIDPHHLPASFERLLSGLGSLLELLESLREARVRHAVAQAAPYLRQELEDIESLFVLHDNDAD